MTLPSHLTGEIHRSATLLTRLADTDSETREIDGVAVPIDQWQEIWPGFMERFAPGSLEPSELGTKLRLEHRTTIGKITSLTETDGSVRFTAKISQTRDGDDAYTLAKDDVLTSASIGFRSDPETMTIVHDDDGAIWVTHNRATLEEISLVSFPAYAAATVDNVRHRKETPMTTETTQETEDVTAIRQTVEDLSRRFDLFTDSHKPTETSPAAAYRSAGEFIKAVISGAAEARALTDNDAVLADSDPQPNWINRAIHTIEARQRITKIFTHTKDLPGAGNTIEYPELESETLAVTKQENEGDTLAYGKIKLTSGSAPISTYGGYAKLSRQAVERSSASYLSVLHRAQSARYGRAIEAATVALARATITQQTADSPITLTKAATDLTVNDLISIVIDLADHYDENVDFGLSGLLVSSDVFKHLALLDETSKALSFIGTPEDKQGTLSITGTGPSARILNLNVERLPVVDEATDTGILSGYSSEAIVIQESPGAPFRLSDQDITELTNVFSVYGYAAHYAPAPSAIVPVNFGA